MKYKVNKKILFCFLALLFLVFTIFLFQTTYARYVTSLTAKSTVEMGSWLIRVNNQNIIENSDISDWVSPVFNSDSEYIAEGKISPTSTGNVLISLDYEEVTVPFKYEISFQADDSTFLEDFKLTGYSVDGGSVVSVSDSDTIITDTISPDETTRTRNFNLNFGWIDGDGSGETLNDIQDTAFSRNNSEVGLRFTIEFTQLQPTM